MPDRLVGTCSAVARRFRVIGAGTGGAVRLPRMVASTVTALPAFVVIVKGSPLNGTDSLYIVV